MATRSFFVTGASNGVGLEATRKLAFGLNINNNNVKIYLLCRSEEKAQAAIEDINKIIGENSSSNDISNIELKFLKFDAYDDAETIRNNIQLANGTQIGGILLNAGGFGDGTTTTDKKSSSSSIARLNIIGHVVLVNHLLSVGKTDESTRIVAAGSEACFVTPGLTMGRYKAEDFVVHLSSTSGNGRMNIGNEYAWTKGILALYWAAFARHHPELFVVTISPGAVSDTQLLSNVPFLLRAVARLSQWQCFGGSHTVEEGAMRYVDVFLTTMTPAESSGAFLASRKGFCEDFGNVSTLSKGRFVTDIELQDKAWEAVHKFLE